MDKKELRKRYKLLRRDFSQDEIDQKSLDLTNNLLKLPIWEGNYYHIFLPIAAKNEVNTEFLLHVLQGKDKSVVVPKTTFSTGKMEAILLQENTTIAPSDYDIPEPLSGVAIDPKLIDIVFVPLLAFDLKGNRVGYGKGFYDKFLEQCTSRCLFVGLSFFQAEDSISHEETDIPLNYCATPSKLYTF